MALFSGSRSIASNVTAFPVVDRRTLATNQPINGIRIVKVSDGQEAERLLNRHLGSFSWKLMTRHEKGEIELFRAINSVDSDIAAIIATRAQKVIEIIQPIKDNLTTAKALSLISEAVVASGYELVPSIATDRSGTTWSMGALPDTLDLANDWSLVYGGLIDLPKTLISDGNVVINATVVRKTPSKIRIGKTLDLSFSEFGILTGDTIIGGDLIASDCLLTAIDNGAQIRGSLRANGSKLEWLSSKVLVGSHVDVANTPLAQFDEDITVNGRLLAENVPATEFGRGLTVKGDCILKGAKLHALPKDSLFEADVYIDNPNMIIPRSAHILGRLLVFGVMGYQVVDPLNMKRQ